MTWIEVVDTAIKIGGGALVAGFFGYLLATVSYRNDSKKVYLQKRREKLDKVLDIINSFSKLYAHYWADVGNYIIDQKECGTDTKDYPLKLNNQYEELRMSFDKIIDAYGYILIIDEDTLHADLMDYREMINDKMNALHYNKDLTIELVKSMEEEVMDIKEKLFKSLSDAYKGSSSKERRFCLIRKFVRLITVLGVRKEMREE